MKTYRSRMLIAALALLVQAPAFTANPHAHHGAAPAQLTLNQGQKWATDEPLRAGMGEIRALLAPKLESIHQGKLSRAEYARLGADIERQVGKIVAECKLEPKADAMLHLVIADLTAGADAMQGKVKTRPAAGAHKIVTALNAYGRTFDHPSWAALR